MNLEMLNLIMGNGSKTESVEDVVDLKAAVCERGDCFPLNCGFTPVISQFILKGTRQPSGSVNIRHADAI